MSEQELLNIITESQLDWLKNHILHDELNTRRWINKKKEKVEDVVNDYTLEDLILPKDAEKSIGNEEKLYYIISSNEHLKSVNMLGYNLGKLDENGNWIYAGVVNGLVKELPYTKPETIVLLLKYKKNFDRRV